MSFAQKDRPRYLETIALGVVIFSISLGQTRSLAEDSHPRIPLCKGVTYFERSESMPRPLKMHIARIDLKEPSLSFKLLGAGGQRDTIRKANLRALMDEKSVNKKACLATNAHFFSPFPSLSSEVWVAGLAVSQGKVIAPFRDQPINNESPDQSFAIVPFAPALNINQENQVSIVHRDPRFTDNHHVLEPVQLFTTVSGSAQIITDGKKTIPSYSGANKRLNALQGYSDVNSWYDVKKARTVIGYTENKRTLILFTVDQSGGSEGMSGGEVADLLIKDYLVFQALNLDGGGSTSLSIVDPASSEIRYANVPSELGGRTVADHLVVSADSLLPSGPANSATPGPAAK